jgi:hypothetical protein
MDEYAYSMSGDKIRKAKTGEKSRANPSPEGGCLKTQGRSRTKVGLGVRKMLIRSL